MSTNIARESVQAMGEFLGTFFFIFSSLSSVQSSLQTVANATHMPKGMEQIGNSDVTLIALGFGISLMIAVWLFYRISGGVLNPAITFALVLLRKITVRKALLYLIAQIAGAVVAAEVVSQIFPGVFIGANALQNGVSQVQAVFLEMLFTAMLVLVVLFLAVEKSRATFLAPVAIGLQVFFAHLCLIPYDGTSLNPARSFAGSVAANVWDNQWIFWLGPMAGGGLAAGIYAFFRQFGIETLNPGQDDDCVRGDADVQDDKAAEHDSLPV